MKKDIRTSRIIKSTTFAMLAFFALITGLNLFFLETSSNTLKKLDQHYNQKIYHTLKLEEITRERTLAMLTMYMSDDPWQRDELYLEFHQMAVEFIQHRDALHRLDMEPSERQLFDTTMPIIRKTQPIQNATVEQLHIGQIAGLRETISSTDLPIEVELHEIFEQMLHRFQDQAKLARAQAHQEHRQITYLGFIISAILLTGIVLLMRKSLYSIGTIEAELLEETENLGWKATHDPLTKLLNRRGLMHHIDLLNLQSHETHHHILLYLDLDDFKPVNDQFGHDVGDSMLCGLSNEFLSCIRKHDALARIGGDEFVVILEDCEIDIATRIAENIIKKAREYVIHNDGVAIQITGCSIGLLPFSPGVHDVDSLLKQADKQCYNSKREGKNRLKIDMG